MKGTSLMDMTIIVPIILALLLFFGSVVSAINTVSEKNRKIDLVFSLVNVVDTLTQAGVITQKNFGESVALLQKTLSSGFYVCITDVNDEEYEDCELVASKEEGNIEERRPQEIINTLHNKDYVSFAFPVTVQEEKDGIPFNEVKKALVVVWEEG